MFGRTRRPPPVEPEPLPPLPEGGAMEMIFTRAAERAPDLIAPASLVPPVWRLSDADGAALADGLRFLPDGRLLGGDRIEAASWALREGRLDLAAPDGRVVVALRASEAVRGAVRLGGEAVGGAPGGPDGPAIRRLEPVRDDLRVRASLGGSARALLVRISRDGADGTDGAAADRALVDEAEARTGADRIELAERGDPAFFFLNKTVRVVALLRNLVPPGTDRVVLVGAGRCGFAAMLLGEMLAAAMTDRAVRTLVLNPLIALTGPGPEAGAEPDAEPDEDAAAAAAAAADPALAPPATEPDALAQADTWFVDVAKARGGLARKGGDIAHAVLFDRANPAAARHARLAGALDGTVLWGERASAAEAGAPLGLPFEEGARVLAGSDAAREALARLLDPPDAGTDC